MSEKKQQAAYPLRMTPELRDAIEKAAQDSKRSLNAEIVTRLELSLIADDRSTTFLSAEKARELVALAEGNLTKKIHDSIQRSIALSAVGGQTRVVVSLSPFNLDSNDDAHMDTLKTVIRRLEDAGYSVEINGLDRITLSF
ncbi:Arc family DNA-binding protein [Pseudomonas sp. R11F]|uniref:Arc family DNA-binding protein n=1 Tax=Pseudomonas TaxID=286 RepID=UPI00398E88EA